MVGVIKVDGSTSGRDATTGARRMTSSRAFDSTTAPANPAAASTPAAIAEKAPADNGLQRRAANAWSVWRPWSRDARSARRRFCRRPLNDAEGWMVGRFRATSNARRIRVSSCAQRSQNRRCRAIPSSSTPLSVSSMYASCLRRNSRQFMRTGCWLGPILLPSVPAVQGAVPHRVGRLDRQNGRSAHEHHSRPEILTPHIRPPQSTQGSMISAKAFRARFNRDFTVPRLQSVISAISSYDLPSSSRNTNTCR